MTMFTEDPWLWVMLSVGCYIFFAWLQGRIHSERLRPFLNPLLLSVMLLIGILTALGIPYETYNQGGQYINFFVTPATIALGIKLYENLPHLKRHYRPILIGIISGVVLHTALIILLVKVFHLSPEIFATLYPKSITTAIAVGVSGSVGGIVPLTVAIVVVTGVVGAAMSDALFAHFKIKHPVAQGVALGTSAHAVGTSKAIELGEVQGSMSSVSIIVTGIVIVALAPFVPYLLALI